MRMVAILVVCGLALASCADGDTGAATNAPAGQTTATSTVDDAVTAAGSDSAPGSDSTQEFPDVVEVEVTPAGEGRFEFAVTISSPYDSPARYADAWRVLGPDGEELGVRELTHDHAGEQPFTRSTTVDIPEGVDEVTVQGRDLKNGYGGTTRTVMIPSR